MHQPPRIGARHEQTYSVEAAHAIELAPGRLPAVLATPGLIWFLEQTSLSLLKPFLTPDEISVGVQIDVEHLAPTRIGAEVTCSARVVHVEGARITLQVEARDDTQPVARGLHRRRVVTVERLARRIGGPAPDG